MSKRAPWAPPAEWAEQRPPLPTGVPEHARCLHPTDYDDTGWRWWIWREPIAGDLSRWNYHAYPVHRSGIDGEHLVTTESPAIEAKDLRIVQLVREIAKIPIKELILWPGKRNEKVESGQ